MHARTIWKAIHMKRVYQIIRLALFVPFAIMAIASTATAQDAVTPEQMAAAKRYLGVADMRKMLEQTIPKVAETVAQQLQQRSPGKFEKDALSFFQKRFFERMFLDHWTDFESSVLNLMAQTFTVEELNALADFFGSPVGKSVMGKFPTFMVGQQKFIGKWLQDNVRNAMHGAAEDTRKQGYKFELPK